MKFIGEIRILNTAPVEKFCMTSDCDGKVIIVVPLVQAGRELHLSAEDLRAFLNRTAENCEVKVYDKTP